MAIAYFSTWTTYGTWLPGDERGWFERGNGLQPADLMRRLESALRMTEHALTLDRDQRRLVEATIAKHCAIRHWTLHAVNCRSNHVHTVVTAANRDIEIPREQFKAWCTRKLKELEMQRRKLAGRASDGVIAVREHWWTERGWDIYIDDEAYLLEITNYVLHEQGR
jgi:REP element-mobilizing transposase RayT